MDAIKYFANRNQPLFEGFVGQINTMKKLFGVLDILAIATKKVQGDSFALTDFFWPMVGHHNAFENKSTY